MNKKILRQPRLRFDTIPKRNCRRTAARTSAFPTAGFAIDIADRSLGEELDLPRSNGTHGDGYASQGAFYDEAKDTVSAIKARAALLPKNSGTIKNLDELSGQYDRLAELHRQGPLVGLKAKIARELIDSNFRSLMQLELHKKLGATVGSSDQPQH
jgi:hypothetical protein